MKMILQDIYHINYLHNALLYNIFEIIILYNIIYDRPIGDGPIEKIK